MSVENSLSPRVQNYWRHRNNVVGAFWDIDFVLFDQILSWQSKSNVAGDLLEIGALYGKSAIVLGCHADREQKVIVCDIFEDTEGDAANLDENSESYGGLTRSKFESNYSAWVSRPPVVIAEVSEKIVGAVEPRSLRFAHIDGSHLYEIVQLDINNTRNLLQDDGVIVMDDFRALHTPGVAAAVWQSVGNDGLIPVCVTEQKFYGTWDNRTASMMSAVLTQWAVTQSDGINYGFQQIAGSKVLILQNPPIKTPTTAIERLLPAKLRRRIALPYLGTKH